MRFRLKAALLLAAGWLANGDAEAQAGDTLQLSNNQVLLGRTKGFESGLFRFSIDGAGDVLVPVAQIRSLTPLPGTYRVETADLRVITGPVRLANGFLIVAGPGREERIPASAVLSLRSFRKSGFYPLAVQVTAGVSGSRSSDVTVFQADGNARFLYRRSHIGIQATSQLTYLAKSMYRNREESGLQHYYPVHRRLYVGARLQYQRNREQDLSARFTAAGGLQWTALQRQRLQASVVAGLSHSLENHFSTAGNRSWEVPVQVQVRGSLSWLKPLQFSSNHSMYVSLGGSRIRHDGDLRLEWATGRHAALSLYAYDAFDSQIRSPADRRLDLGWSLGIRYQM